MLPRNTKNICNIIVLGGPVTCISFPLVGTGDAHSACQAQSSSPGMEMDGAWSRQLNSV